MASIGIRDGTELTWFTHTWLQCHQSVNLNAIVLPDWRSSRRRWWTMIDRGSKNSWAGTSFRSRKRQSRSSDTTRSSASGTGTGSPTTKLQPAESPTENRDRTINDSRCCPNPSLSGTGPRYSKRWFAATILSIAFNQESFNQGRVKFKEALEHLKLIDDCINAGVWLRWFMHMAQLGSNRI